MKPPSLYELSRQKTAPHFSQRFEKALETYLNLFATPFTSSLPTDIIPAAYYGRISHLFIQKGAHLWGKFNEQNNQLSLHNVQGEDEDCLVDKAIVYTLFKGGEVYILEKDQMPADTLMVAVLKY